MSRASLLAAPLALVLAACGATTDTTELDGGAPDASQDVGIPDAQSTDATPTDGGPPADAESSDLGERPTEGVEVGTGWENFIALQTNGTVELIAGPQGGSPFYGFHIWMAARVDPTFLPTGAMVNVDILRADTQESLISGGFYTFDLTPVAGGFEAFGLRGTLRNCCDAENRDLQLTVEVIDSRGKVGRDRRTVHAAGPCRDPLNPTYDPCP
ncbi:MAG: hypothetical protein IPG45_27885 [Deltaproteobacteria bacterium]|jgi:hypothetical protein|nr:hypothetical protein [Deltaproteobacteria bacterium]